MASNLHHGINLVSLIVKDYDEAISFFVKTLGFTLTEDSPSTSTATGAAKRWVTVHPPSVSAGSGCGILLAKADGEEQQAVVGKQWAGRVGLFLRVDDFETQYRRMKEQRVVFLGEPRAEEYGKVVVFRDLYGNKWDLLGPV